LDIIQSRDNALIKNIKKLKEKKYRLQQEAFLIEGFRFVEEALKSDFEIETIFISENVLNNTYTVALMELIHSDTKVYCVSNNVFKDICDTETPQGIAACVKLKKYNLQDRDGFYVLVDRIQDPGNMGTIIRTAHAAGALGVIYTKGTVDVYNEKTLRATMGSIFNIPVIEDSELKSVNELKSRGFQIVVSSLDTDNNFFDVNLRGNLMLCIGNEGNGISEVIYALADKKVKIPMPGGAESLNASIAASVMIYEIVRQKLL
jgi:TrmH family RNA methyltransferase